MLRAFLLVLAFPARAGSAAPFPSPAPPDSAAAAAPQQVPQRLDTSSSSSSSSSSLHAAWARWLDATWSAVTDPASSQHRRFVTQAEVVEQLRPLDADRDAALEWIRSKVRQNKVESR